MTLIKRVSCLFLVLPIFAYADISPGEKLIVINKGLDQFEKECLDSENQIKLEPKWCIDEYNHLQSELQTVTTTINNGIPNLSTEKTCRKQDSTISALSNDVDSMISQMNLEGPTCEKDKNTEMASAQCMKELACNFLRPAINLNLFNSTPKNTCQLSNENSTNCFAEIFHGIFNSIVTNLKGLLVDLPVLAGKAVAYTYEKSKQAASDFWDKLWTVEENTSDKLLLVSSQNDSSISQMITDSLGFMKTVGGALMEMLNRHIKKSYGCEKWSGTPYTSTCLQPMQSWDCATCNQRLNAICGIVGLLGGEIVSAYLVGGIFAVGKFLGSEGARGIAITASIISKTSPTLASASAKLGGLAKLTGKGFVSGARLTGKGLVTLYNSTVSRPAGKLLLAAKGPIQRANEVILSKEKITKIATSLGIVATDVSKGAISVLRVAIYAPSKYLEVMNKATELGFRQTSQLKILNQSQQGYQVVLSNPESLRPGDIIQASDQKFRRDSRPQQVTVDGNKITFITSEDGKNLVVEKVEKL